MEPFRRSASPGRRHRWSRRPLLWLAALAVNGGALFAFLGPARGGRAGEVVARRVAAVDSEVKEEVKAVLEAARRKGPMPKVRADVPPGEDAGGKSERARTAVTSLDKREETLKARMQEEAARAAGEKPEGVLGFFTALGEVIEGIMSKFATRAGVIALMFGLILFGFGIKWGFEALGVDNIQAGFYTTGIFAVLTILYSITYVTRVLTKTTTFASQLKNYERDVLAQRVSELTDEELDVLLQESGAADVYQDIEDYQDSIAPDASASKKDKVLYLIRNTEMPSADIREGLGIF